jgi:hypothetical protein
MLRLLTFVSLLFIASPLVNGYSEPIAASVVGSSVGSGATRGEAYSMALGQLPTGARVYSKIDSKLGDKWQVTLLWRL